MHRKPVNKFKSAKNFRRNVAKTKAANFIGVMRGGIRL
nr:MAG: hypothetical protein [Microvirus sp.]